MNTDVGHLEGRMLVICVKYLTTQRPGCDNLVAETMFRCICTCPTEKWQQMKCASSSIWGGWGINFEKHMSSLFLGGLFHLLLCTLCNITTGALKKFLQQKSIFASRWHSGHESYVGVPREKHWKCTSSMVRVLWADK